MSALLGWPLTRRLMLARLLLLMLALAPAYATQARAATVLDIRGGGDGHGIGLSQYGAYGYALHGADYRSILGHYYPGTQIATMNPRQVVRVLLKTGSAAFSGATRAGSVRLNPGVTYTVKVVAGSRLALTPSPGGTGSGSAGGRHRKHSKQPRTFAAPLTVSGSAPLTVPGTGTYRGSLQFAPDGQGGVQTVDAVGLDDYVRGVVAAEMPATWATAALEAQAVAARTYAITTAVSASGYNLYDDTRSQMYGGVGAETAVTDAAVAATRGQVVTYDGHPVVTYFFASSGGHTESIQNVWPGSAPAPWLQGVPDPYDDAGGDPYHVWTKQLSAAAAGRKLRGLVKGTLLGIQVTQQGVSPRVMSAQVVGTGGRTTVSGDTLASRFDLLSTDAAFTTITTNGAHGQVSGSVFPSAAGGLGLSLQTYAAGSWRTVGQVQVAGDGGYVTPVGAAGRYRVVDGSLTGPAVTVP